MKRRDLLRTAAAGAGAGLATAGCGDRTARPAPRSPLPGHEGSLAIYNWSDYIAPGTIEAFSRETGIAVSYDTYESNEEMLAKLQAGGGGWDIVVPSSYLVPAMVASGLLQPVRHERLTNWGNIAPLFLDPPFDPGNTHTVPWQWGLTGIAWRRDLVPAPPDSQGVFLDQRWRHRLAMMDDGRVVLGAMLRWRGRSINDTDPAHLAQAKDDAVRAKANLRAYKSAPVKADLMAGDIWIAQLWNGDAAQAALERPEIGFVVPREGSEIWADQLVLLQDAAHPRAAHLFFDYILRPGVGAAIADATGYGTPNAAAAARQDRPVPYPAPAELARLEYLRDLGEATALVDRLWTEIKSA